MSARASWYCSRAVGRREAALHELGGERRIRRERERAGGDAAPQHAIELQRPGVTLDAELHRAARAGELGFGEAFERRERDVRPVRVVAFAEPQVDHSWRRRRSNLPRAREGVRHVRALPTASTTRRAAAIGAARPARRRAATAAGTVCSDNGHPPLDRDWRRACDRRRAGEGDDRHGRRGPERQPHGRDPASGGCARRRAPPATGLRAGSDAPCSGRAREPAVRRANTRCPADGRHRRALRRRPPARDRRRPVRVRRGAVARPTTPRDAASRRRTRRGRASASGSRSARRARARGGARRGDDRPTRDPPSRG